MAGFDNDVMHATNVDFSGTLPVSGQINLDGELLVGSSVAPFIRPYVPLGSNNVSISTGHGTINFSLSGPPSATTLTQNGVLMGNGSSAISAIAPNNNGVLITSAIGIPSISSFLPSTVQTNITSLGTITSGTWNGTTIAVANGGTGNTSQTAFSLVCGGTTTTGAFQAIAPVATGQVLVSGGVGALPSFSASPTLTSVTFGAGAALNDYEEGTWTPTIDGAVSGTTTYTDQHGYYRKIGKIVVVICNVQYSAATGTGAVTLGGLPFTTSSSTNLLPQGTALNATGIAWPASHTTMNTQFATNATTGVFPTTGSSQAQSNIQMTNSTQTWRVDVTYFT